MHSEHLQERHVPDTSLHPPLSQVSLYGSIHMQSHDSQRISASVLSQPYGSQSLAAPSEHDPEPDPDSSSLLWAATMAIKAKNFMWFYMYINLKII